MSDQQYILAFYLLDKTSNTKGSLRVGASPSLDAFVIRLGEQVIDTNKSIKVAEFIIKALTTGYKITSASSFGLPCHESWVYEGVSPHVRTKRCQQFLLESLRSLRDQRSN
jgi:hypothetical protein